MDMALKPPLATLGRRRDQTDPNQGRTVGLVKLGPSAVAWRDLKHPASQE